MKTILLVFLIASAAYTQTPSFDAASIRPNHTDAGGSSIRVSKDLITIENATLKKILFAAYGVPEDRDYMLSGPDWLTTEHFDLQARFPADTPIPQMQQMMQALLADRFKLALHRETRQLPTYALVIAKDGPRIHPVDDGQPKTTSRPGRLEATRIPMHKFADLLGHTLGEPVIDTTALPGVFTFTLEWTPGPSQPDAAPADAATGPSIFTALQEQLGLKLESKKAPVEILVVDHMEKTPTEN